MRLTGNWCPLPVTRSLLGSAMCVQRDYLGVGIQPVGISQKTAGGRRGTRGLIFGTVTVASLGNSVQLQLRK